MGGRFRGLGELTKGLWGDCQAQGAFRTWFSINSVLDCFAKTAKSCGLNGETVDNPEDFKKVLSMSLKSNKTYVIDARIDPDVYQDNFGGTIGD